MVRPPLLPGSPAAQVGWAAEPDDPARRAAGRAWSHSSVSSAGSLVVALAARTLTGVGIGLAHPGLHVRATVDDGGSTEAASPAGDLGISRGDSWARAFAGFAGVLAAASAAGRPRATR